MVNSSLGPKLQFENIIPTSGPTVRPNKLLVTPTASGAVINQFLAQEKERQKLIEEMNKPTEKGEQRSSIQVFNPGSSGLQVVQGAITLDNNQPVEQDQYVLFSNNNNENNNNQQAIPRISNNNNQQLLTVTNAQNGNNDQVFSVGASLAFGGGGAESTTMAPNMIPGKCNDCK